MSTLGPNPLDALNQHVDAHQTAQQALWDEIDSAVSAAHAELEQERAAAQQETEPHEPITDA